MSAHPTPRCSFPPSFAPPSAPYSVCVRYWSARARARVCVCVCVWCGWHHTWLFSAPPFFWESRLCVVLRCVCTSQRSACAFSLVFVPLRGVVREWLSTRLVCVFVLFCATQFC